MIEIKFPWDVEGNCSVMATKKEYHEFISSLDELSVKRINKNGCLSLSMAKKLVEGMGEKPPKKISLGDKAVRIHVACVVIGLICILIAMAKLI